MTRPPGGRTGNSSPSERRPIMRFPFLGALAVGLCALASFPHTNAGPITDRAMRQDRSPELTIFQDNQARDAARERAARLEVQRLQGTWTCVRWEEGGKA